MFILDPSAPIPRRERIDNNIDYVDGYAHHANKDGDVFATYQSRIPTGSYSIIYDSPGPRRKWKSCWHNKVTYRPTFFNGLNGGHCPKLDLATCTQYLWADTASALDYSSVIDRPDVQDAFAKVASRYHSQLYQLHNDALPNMAVFLAEVHEVLGLWNQVKDYLWQMILHLRAIRDVRKGVKRSLRARRTSPYARSQRKKMVKLLERRTHQASSQLLGMRFGVKQPLRDMGKILASWFGYWTTFKFPKATIRVREIVNFSVKEGLRRGSTPGSYGCVGDLCYDQSEWFIKEEDYEVIVAAATLQRPQLQGSKFERIFATLLRLTGTVPTPEVVWELTPLSWLVDYFINLDRLFATLNSLVNGVAGNVPVIYDTSISLDIKRKFSYASNCPRWASQKGPRIEGESSHYERLVDRKGYEFANFVDLLGPLPTFTQSQNAFAYLLQTILH